MSNTRRDFLRGAVSATALGCAATITAMGQQDNTEKSRSAAPTQAKATAGRGPVVIGSVNAHPAACDKAMELLRQNTHPVDAVVAGINLVEDDPKDHSVGYGGLPNEEGVVQLDSAVMDGKTGKAGAVAALERIKNPSSVAILVMRRTDHVLLVGEGALRFARAHGFEEMNLLTPEARRIWLEWKETHSDKDDWIRPEADKAAKKTSWRRVDGENFTTGTIHVAALTAGGDIGCCTSTSGLSYKLPGRVGDSPIIGAGLYCDNEVGSCGSTGRGEANLQNCSSFLVVELMRQGRAPEEACLEVLRRVAAKAEPRLLEDDGAPLFDLRFYALRKDGSYGAAGMRKEGGIAVHDGTECKVIKAPALYPTKS
ncbi:MAG: N(4)-(beta-N-acetylglucosaminyl)-L-asparaginase [Phycisphaerales bacterium]|nr:N(4)-(beta-N-acetylglucosaminyl)-L-asparaginase [Phycisphaerales bacterium]